jgi:hypothetical protein
MQGWIDRSCLLGFTNYSKILFKYLEKAKMHNLYIYYGTNILTWVVHG